MNAFLKAAGSWALARLSEPSTWVGAAGVIGGMTFLPHAADIGQALAGSAVVLASTVAVVKKETGQ